MGGSGGGVMCDRYRNKYNKKKFFESFLIIFISIL